MARVRERPCKHYESHLVCSKGRKAEQNGICQTCKSYDPRAGELPKGNRNNKKAKLSKIRAKESRKMDY